MYTYDVEMGGFILVKIKYSLFRLGYIAVGEGFAMTTLDDGRLMVTKTKNGMVQTLLSSGYRPFYDLGDIEITTIGEDWEITEKK